ncbi:MAG: hypothetical protein ABFS45_18720 [Pseudomonadota bacterium]
MNQHWDKITGILDIELDMLSARINGALQRRESIFGVVAHVTSMGDEFGDDRHNPYLLIA